MLGMHPQTVAPILQRRRLPLPTLFVVGRKQVLLEVLLIAMGWITIPSRDGR
ncbi:hypothetical protein BDZ89DRAFT_1059185 [Hymenopellis radicata]|nr:hypothetical protein BDZ89DRAFT_1059185 [Hymenopellis radicata]